jgi:hypothetical protein
VTTTAELEVALEAAWTIENLEVYGDHLQQLGDPRGELIAVDVHLARHGATDDVMHRRRRAIRSWLDLPSHVDPTRGGWGQVAFAFGFVDDVRIEYASRILATRAGHYLRGATLTNKTAGVESALLELARAPRPWLRRLTIAPRVRGRPPERPWRASELPNLANLALPNVIRATPKLERLELAGHRLIKDFPHPTLKQLSIAGIDALLPMLEARPPMPAVTDVKLTFAHAPGEPVVLQRPWPALFPPASFPALRRLDLSGNDLQRSTTDTQLGVFDVLASLAVEDQLEELRLPEVRSKHEVEAVERAIKRMPALRRIEVIRGWGRHAIQDDRVELVALPVPWPRRQVLIAITTIAMRHPADRVPTMMTLAPAIDHCERTFDQLSPEARAAWTSWWEAVETGADHQLAAGPVLLALETFGYLDASREQLRPWAEFRERLREQPCDEVGVGRGPSAGVVRWPT